MIKEAVQKFVRGFGYQFVKVPGATEYENIIPVARYAPWNGDPEFRDVFTKIRNNTLVDIYRAWELWTLVEQTSKLDGAILEVGVWRGGTGALMAKKSMLCGNSAPVYLCDTFRGVVKAGAKDTWYKGGEHANTSREIVDTLLAQVGVNITRILEGIFPEDSASRIEAGMRFRLCHIDVDVYESARDIVNWIWNRMVPGGVIVFDDYGFFECQGIRDFVNEQRSYADRLVLHNLNGHGLVIKIGGAPATTSGSAGQDHPAAAR